MKQVTSCSRYLPSPWPGYGSTGDLGASQPMDWFHEIRDFRCHEINGYNRGHPEEIQIHWLSNIRKSKAFYSDHLLKQVLWDSIMTSCQRAQAIAFTVGASSTVGPHHRRSANNQSALAVPRFVHSKHTMCLFQMSQLPCIASWCIFQKTPRILIFENRKGFSMGHRLDNQDTRPPPQENARTTWVVRLEVMAGLVKVIMAMKLFKNDIIWL